MIAKKVAMKAGRTSSFGGLVKYITGEQGKAERIGAVQVTNCHNQDLNWATTEVLHVQSKNQRAEGDKTYHLLISFPPGEVPTLDVLRDIEARVCASLGFEDHQRVSAIHNDTDSLHIHVAINKIHPERLTMHEPYRDFHTLGNICAKLEAEYGLQETNHAGKKRAGENRSDDMERIAGVESLLGWIKRECLPQLKQTETWDAFHQALRENGLSIKPNANGLVVTNDGGFAVKASSIDRELSKPKLEAKFGPYIKPTKTQPTVSPQSTSEPTTTTPQSLAELTDPRQIVTIFRGEGEGNAKNGEWWTFDRDKAERFAKEHNGSVRQVDVKAGDLARIAAVGHGGRDELVLDATRLASITVDRAALEKARSIPKTKPPVAKVGEKPPPFRRGKVRALDQLDTLEIDSGKRYVPRPMASRIDTTELYSQYKAQQANLTSGRTKEWSDARERKDARIDAAKRGGKLKRAATKLLGESGAQKRLIYALTSKALRADIQKINAEYMKERQVIFERYQRQAWADWLQKEARSGNQEALEALRAREAKGTGRRNGVRGQGNRTAASANVLKHDTITKGGTVIYRVGESAIRDDGAELKLSNGAKSDALEAALRMAMQRYGSRITVNGTAEFQAQIAHVAAKANLSLTFDDPALERRRQALLRSTPTTQENNHESRIGRGNRSGDAGRRHEHRRSLARHIASGRAANAAQRSAGAADLIASVRAARSPATPARGLADRGSAKRNVAAVGRNPPPLSQNRLRNLSQLGVVHLDNRSEVLLPRHVSRDVERQGTQRPDELRRVVDRAGRGIEGNTPSAAMKFIAEREGKRLKGFDIPKHKLYNDRETGPATYAGTRQSEGQFLALLKRDEEITVMPVDEAVARSLKRLKLGDAVSIAPNGALDTSAVKKRGRSR